MNGNRVGCLLKGAIAKNTKPISTVRLFMFPIRHQLPIFPLVADLIRLCLKEKFLVRADIWPNMVRHCRRFYYSIPTICQMRISSIFRFCRLVVRCQAPNDGKKVQLLYLVISRCSTTASFESILVKMVNWSVPFSYCIVTSCNNCAIDIIFCPFDRFI